MHPKPNSECYYSYTGSYTQVWFQSVTFEHHLVAPSSRYQLETFTKWGEGQPQCEEDFNSCAYISTSGSVNNWATHYCSYPEMFGCEVEPGRMIHNIEKPMMNYHCRESDNAWHSDWVLNPKNKKCYLIGRSSVIDGSGLWLNATAARIGSNFL